MNKNTLIQLRDEDFTDCLRTTLRRLRDERRYLSAEHIIAEALASRPRRYYLSYATIASRLPKLRKSGQLNVAEGKRVNRAVGQWADINSAVDRYLSRHKRAKVAEAITYVVNFERPSRFFIPDKRARELLYSLVRPTYSLVV
jgi:hypothetical protein